MKPIIGIVVAVSQDANNLVALESRYMHLIEKSGGIPVLFPIYREGLIPHKKLVSLVDGILLTGSFILKDEIVHRKLSRPTVSLREINPIYYDYCMKLIKLAKNINMPIVGVCRGMQLLSEEAGGIIEKKDNHKIKINHKQETHPETTQHKIIIKDGTLLQKYCGQEMDVNSFHRQFLTNFPKNYILAAFSEDNHPEAIEYKYLDKWFSLGFQFHPEWLFEQNSGVHKIFKHFVKACKE